MCMYKLCKSGQISIICILFINDLDFLFAVFIFSSEPRYVLSLIKISQVVQKWPESD